MNAMTITEEPFDPLVFCAPVDEPDRRRAMIAEAAYFLAERRGFAVGHEVEDWLAAQDQIDTLLARGGERSQRRPVPSPRKHRTI